MSVANNDARTRVLEAVNIVELIGQTVKLKRRGKTYVGLCPFHSEKTPSFHVDPAKQYFHCFGCKAGSNAIDFVMRRDRLSFLEAMQYLSRQYGIELPRFSGNKQDASERQILLDAQSAACGLFEKLLAHPQIGQGARDYLAGRGFNAETIRKFQIGLAVESWDALLKSQAMKRFTPQQLASAGLVKPRESGEGFYDTFRNRIMFPIRDEQGRIIAFGGRVVPGSQDPAKYLNSPETPLFSKGRCVYGLDLAKQKIVETKTAAVVEGYTDVVMSHQYGATNVVSVLGTAMTDQHVNLLRRFADRIVLLFDADNAGDLAVNRAVEMLLSQEVEIAIASMPDGVDPDEYLMANGVETFQKLLDNAQDVLSYKWRQLVREYAASKDVTGQQRAIEQFLGLLAGARGSGSINPLRWGAILARVSRLTDIPAGELNRRFRVTKKRPAAPVAASGGQSEGESPDQPASAAPRRMLTAHDRAERWALGIVLLQPQRWTDVQQVVQPEHFSDEQHQRLARSIWTQHRDEGELALNEMLGVLEDHALKELAVMLVDEIEAFAEIESFDLEKTLLDAVRHMRDAQRRREENKLVAAAKGDGMSPQPECDEVELLRQLQERARQPDMRRAAT